MALAKMQCTVESYKDARSVFQKHQNRKGNVELGHNTKLIHNEETDSYSIMYHKTKIITFYPGGAIELENGGWYSASTRERFRFFGVNLGQTNYNWWVSHGGKSYPFKENMVLEPDGSVSYRVK